MEDQTDNPTGMPMESPQPTQDNKTKAKKPFWKKWWFWLIVVIVVIGLAAGGGNEGNDKNPSSTSGTSTSQSDKSEKTEKKVTSISATYAGSTDEGTTVDSNSAITVTATYDDGTTENVDGWTVQNPGPLTAGQETVFTVEYDDVTCDMPLTGVAQVPTEYKNALKKAESYSSMMHMSKQGIYDQLTSEYGEQFSAEAAQYAIDNLQADYKANALEKAKSYQDTMAMSPNAIYDQLVSEYGEKFTPEEAQYAIDNLNK